MTEPRFANYIQLYVTDSKFKWTLCNILNKGNVTYHFSKASYTGNDYFLFNIKHRKGVWKSIKTETKVKVIDAAFMEQLEFLGKISVEAQVDCLLAPV